MVASGSTRVLGRLQHDNGLARYTRPCTLCFRELLHVAMSLAYCLVIPQYKVLPQLCSAWQHGRASWNLRDVQGAWNVVPHPEQLSLLCEPPWGTWQPPPRAQPIHWTATAYLKGAATQLWLSVMTLHDPSVTAHLAIVLIHISTLLLLAWHSRPTGGATALPTWHQRKATKVAVRLLAALSHCSGYLTRGTTPYHVLEVQLRDGQRLQLFASVGWMDGWLFPVPLMWQVPMGLMEYTAFTAACSWYDARAGRPAASWQQHLLEFLIMVVAPILYVWYRTWKEHPPADPTAGSSHNSGTIAAASCGKHYNKSSTSNSSTPSSSSNGHSGTRCIADPPATTAANNGDGVCNVPGASGGPLQREPLPGQEPAPAAAHTHATPPSGPTPDCMTLQPSGAVGVTTGNPPPATKAPLFYRPVTTLVAFSFKVEAADFAAEAQGCIAPTKRALMCAGQRLPLASSIVAVPGCVLLLGEAWVPTILPTNGGFAQELYSQRSSSCMTALDGAAWAVQLQLSGGVLGVMDGTHNCTVGACYANLEQLRQEAESGRLLDTVMAASSSSAGLQHATTDAAAAPSQRPAPAAVVAAPQQFSGLSAGRDSALAPPPPPPPPATAGCCQQGFCAVGTWGRPVVLQLHLSAGSLPAGQSDSNSSQAVYNSSHSSQAMHGTIRVVLAGDSGVLLDEVLPLTAVAVAADGSASVQVQLQPPPDMRSATEAAFNLYLLTQQTPPATAARQLPLAQLTLLMLEEPLAAELITWAHCHHVAVCQLSGLVGDLAVLLDTCQQLQEAWRHRQEAEGNLTLPDADLASASALACVHLAVTAADHLGPYMSASGLPLAADLVAGVKQQVLVGAARLQPPAAGRVGPQQLGAPAATGGSSSMQHQPQLNAATATGPAAATGFAASSSPDQDRSSRCAPAWQVHLLDASSISPPQFAPSGHTPGSHPLQQQPAAVTASQQDSCCSIAMQTPGGAASSSKAGASGSEHNALSSKGTGAVGAGGGEPAAAGPLLVTAAERQAVARGGWQGALLCWRGFSGPGTEQAYLLFKSDHLWVWDWVCLVYYLVMVLMVMARYVKLTGQSLWPPHRVYGLHGLGKALARMLAMRLDRSRWRLVRQTYILLHYMRLPFWMLWEAYMWPLDVLTAVRGNANKLLLFVPINLVIALAVPKLMLKMWAILAPSVLLLTLVDATPNTPGVGGWVHHCRGTGGTPLLLYCLSFALVTFAMTMCMSVVTDLWGRQAFLKTQQKQKRQ